MGPFFIQHGPGAENASGGVAQAYGDSGPGLGLPAGDPRRLAHVPYNFNSTLQMAGVSKHAEPVTVGAEVPNIFRRAFTQLRNGRPQPVVVEIPYDSFDDEVPEPLNYTAVVRTRSGPDPEDVVKVADVLMKAKRPVIYAGQGVHWAEAYTELQELAELLAIPVCTSLPGKISFNETHAFSLGSGGNAHPKTVPHFLRHSDVIFGIGCSFTESPFASAIPTGKTVIHATLDPVDINKSVIAQYALVGDAKLTLKALLAACRKHVTANRDWTSVTSEIEKVS